MKKKQQQQQSLYIALASFRNVVMYQSSTYFVITHEQITHTVIFIFKCCIIFTPLSFLSHLLIAGCDIGVQISVCPYVRSSIRSSVRLLTFTSKFSFLDIRDSCESEFCHYLRRSLVFSTSEIAVSLKPCIVIVLDIPFKHAP